MLVTFKAQGLVYFQAIKREIHFMINILVSDLVMYIMLPYLNNVITYSLLGIILLKVKLGS
jgi:hypothetical protein